MNKNNKGFSLVEVLIAMTVLAIIVVPLLRAFSTSANVNAKAERLMNANNIAQNIIEELKAEGLEAIAEAGYKKVNSIEEGIKEEDDTEDTVVYRYDDSEGLKVGEAYYDVEISVKPNQNGKKNFASMNSMNEPDCAYYAQPEDLDHRAAEKFQIRNLAYIYDATAQLDSEAFKTLMSREIRLDITTERVDVTYTYSIPYAENGIKYAAPEDSVYQEKITIFDKAVGDEDLEAVYLYFYPFYTEEDNEITIVKSNDSKADVYLLQMQLLGEIEDGDWWPTVRSIAAEDGISPNPIEVCSNMNPNTYISQAVTMKSIGNLKEVELLYDVTIRVYTHQGIENRYGKNYLIETYESSFLNYD